MRWNAHLAGAAAAAQEQHQDVEHEHDGAIHLQGVCSYVDAPPDSSDLDRIWQPERHSST